ncbi:MAG TPA: DUF3142 domain-containing protein [Stellaceae bacterium]|nr:DUF3142 domain-containing protein [Stellaceae bacterium]
MSYSWLRLLLILLPTACLAASSATHGALPQDAYVWQRHWTPEVASALAQSADLVRAWRVLAARSDGAGRLRATAADWSALAATKRPTIPVFRIDGQLAQWDEARLLADLREVLSRWRASSVAIVGVEIDHDCATARLPAYARFLTKLRAELDGTTPLSITVLPTWLGSREFDRVQSVADETVLQVHAVQDPHVGLFDAATALRWIETLGWRSSKPFRIALPAYGTRVSWGEDGRIRAVESEAPLLVGTGSAVELIASPLEVASLLRRLERARPAQLAGIVWFRLPTSGDSRAWSPATWRAVILDQPLRARIEARTAAGVQAGLSNLVLVNAGDVDAELPQRVALPGSCAIADGVNGYSLAQTGDGPTLERLQSGLLHGHHQQTIGWMRCGAGPGEMHVQP